MYKKAFFIVLIAAAILSAQSKIPPSQPTHLFYTPTAYVNPPDHFVAGLHEISYAFPGNLQLQLSLIDNIGRINAGGKFGIAENLSVGAGLAYSFLNMGTWGHGIERGASPRLGLFLAYGFIQNEFTEAVVTPHTQIGDRFSLGCDLGFKTWVVDMWAIMAEIGTSIDFSDRSGPCLYLFGIGGVRINPPSIPFMYFDFGINLSEWAPRYSSPRVGVYLDATFTIITI